MPITQDRMLSVIDAGMLYQQSFNALKRAIEDAVAAVTDPNHAARASAESELLYLIVKIKECTPDPQEVAPLFIEQNHFDRMAGYNARSRDRQSIKRAIAQESRINAGGSPDARRKPTAGVSHLQHDMRPSGREEFLEKQKNEAWVKEQLKLAEAEAGRKFREAKPEPEPAARPEPLNIDIPQDPVPTEYSLGKERVEVVIEKDPRAGEIRSGEPLW